MNDLALMQRESMHPQLPAVPDLATFIIDNWNDSCQVNRQVFAMQRQELDYAYKLKHYKYDTGQSDDKRLLQPHGPELFDTLRHEWSEMCRAPVYIECRPQQPGQDDPQLSADAKLAIESVVRDPLKLYSKIRRRWVMGALAARSWVMAVDVIKCKGRPEVSFRLVPPWFFHRAPGYQDIHDEACPWVMEELVMRFSDVLARGKSEGWDTKGIYPDGSGPHQPGMPADTNVPIQSMGGTPTYQPSETDTLRVLKTWFRYDDETYDVTTRMDLAPHEQYGECIMCGRQAMNVPRGMNGAVLPAEDLPGCQGPDCGGPLLPIRQVERVDTFARWPDGRLVIVAPGCRKVLLNRGWPQKMRTFPYGELRCYDHPLDPQGIGETTLHWSSQMILNNLRRFGWEQMRRNVDVMVAPWGALKNSKGQPWSPTDQHGQVAWWDKKAGIELLPVLRHFQGAGIPSGLPTLYQMFASQFQQARGTDQIGLTPEQSKDIPVGTTNALLKQGAVPTADKAEMMQEEESIIMGVVLDILCQIWGDERAVEFLGPDGVWRVKNLLGAALTSQRVVVSASPSASLVRADEIRDFTQWAQLMATDPAAAFTVAELGNVPLGIVQRYLERRKAMASLVQPQPPASGGPGAPSGAPPMAGAAAPAPMVTAAAA